MQQGSFSTRGAVWRQTPFTVKVSSAADGQGRHPIVHRCAHQQLLQAGSTKQRSEAAHASVLSLLRQARGPLCCMCLQGGSPCLPSTWLLLSRPPDRECWASPCTHAHWRLLPPEAETLRAATAAHQHNHQLHSTVPDRPGPLNMPQQLTFGTQCRSNWVQHMNRAFSPLPEVVWSVHAQQAAAHCTSLLQACRFEAPHSVQKAAGCCLPVMPAAMLMMSVSSFIPDRASVSTCCTY